MEKTETSSEIKKVTRFIPKKLALFILGFDIAAFVIIYNAQQFIIKLSWVCCPALNSISFPTPASFHFVFFIAFTITTISIFANNGDYTRRIPWWSQVRNIVKIVAIALLLNGFAYFSLQISISPLVLFTNWAIAGLVLVATRIIAFHFVNKSSTWELPVVILGDKQMILDTLFAFSSDGHTGYKPKYVLLRDKGEQKFSCDCLPAEYKDIKIQKVSNEYDEFIKNNPSYFYIIGMEGFRGENRDALIESLDSNGVGYSIVPPTGRLYTQGMRPHHFFGTDVILLQDYRSMSMPLSAFLKRLMDITVSACSFSVLGIIVAIVFVLKKLEGSDTPVFYSGERLGKDGKMFKCWKFCTMKENGDQILDEYLEQNPETRKEWDVYKKLKNDPRIDSRISEILRKTSLDEAPQLWNVFIGDMGLVGPRPILGDQEEEYGENISLYCSIRPGLTGLWQVSGRNEVSFEQRVVWDDWYIRNWSLWSDFVIIFKTIAVLITRKGAY